MTQDTDFRKQLLPYFDEFQHALATTSGDWTVKGFIDIYRNIYTLSIDTKVISEIIELMLFPLLSRFASDYHYRMILSEHQNYYPDITFVDEQGEYFALDLKSTYRTSTTRVNGFTLGAFTGYFRQRRSTKNVTFPHSTYRKHFVLGVLYTRNELTNAQHTYTLADLQNIVSVVRDFTFILQEKWRIASDHPGSGNTKNIGSERDLETLVCGNGPFKPHGQAIFDDYWTNYLTRDMARAIDSEVPYHNLEEYWKWRNR